MIRELGPSETHLAASAMAELRTHRTPDEIVRRIDDLQRPEGYRLVASFDDGEDDAAAVAGLSLAAIGVALIGA